MPGDARAAREALFRTIGACPRCGGALTGTAAGWRCAGCAAEFARGRSAFFVLDELAEERQVREKVAGRAAWKRALHAPSLSYNSRQRAVQRLVESEQGPVVDLGSGKRRLGPRVLNLEIAEYDEVDVASGAPRLPLADRSVALLVCQAVLEHVPDPAALVAEIRRVLRPGGRCYLEIPFLQAFHADPDDYQRLTHQGFRHLCREFEILDEGTCVGPWSALAWQLREVVLVPIRPGRLRVALQHLLGWLLSPLPQLDRWYERYPEARRAAGGLYVLARRP